MSKSKPTAPASEPSAALDTCPQCGGAFIVDEKQRPETLIARKRANASMPVVVERFVAHVEAKAAEHGIIHRCVSCGYRSRFHSSASAAA